MAPLERLALLSIVFFAIHALVSGTRLRTTLVRALGERAFRGLFALASLVSLGALWLAYRSAPCAPLWVLPRAFGWFPLLVVPFALFFVAGAFSTPNPTAIGGERALERGEPARGILRITRHPFLWGVILWSSAHLLVLGGAASLWFFGSLWLTAALGTRSIDRKRAASQGDAWQSYRSVTSNLPFAAIFGGRNRLQLRELRLPAVIAAVLTAALLASHRWLFDVSPFPDY
ncbi:MAG TPA: NnrU family protein [Polyangiaceae bacterium]|nr:NnrU family protein [Polyangiaceae bacterium]